jgi:hypothetical protein
MNESFATLTLVSMAYKYVAVLAMINEVTFCAKRLDIQIGAVSSAEVSNVGAPRLEGFSGSVRANGYVFSFLDDGRLRFITRVGRFEKLPIEDLQRKLAAMRSVIGTNEAYSLATNWLAAMSVDVTALEKSQRPMIEQQWCFPFGQYTSSKDAPHILLPIFDVTWGKPDDPAISVKIFGPTKELLELRQNDDTFSRRPKDLITNAEGLLAIPDADFLKMSEVQRTNLFLRFAVVKYPRSPIPQAGGSAAKTGAAGEERQPAAMPVP